MKSITKQELATLRKTYLADDVNRIVRNALTDRDLESAASVFEAKNANPNLFSIELETMPVTNQKASGRCWIFSTLNVLREMIAKKYNIRNFELSQNYIAFYDKLEKCNWFMNCVIAEGDKPLDDRTMQWLLDNGISDGGQWDMAVSLIRKYGICPKEAMLETYASSHTARMNGLLNQRLRRFALDVR
jgi:bleomycin hydrolase